MDGAFSPYSYCEFEGTEFVKLKPDTNMRLLEQVLPLENLLNLKVRDNLNVYSS